MSGTTGIARSLTTRMNRKKSVTEGSGNNSGLGRAFSMRRMEKQPPRPEISLPVKLLSATNPLAYQAPDLPKNASGSATSPNDKSLNAVPSSASLRSESSVPALSSAASTTMTFSGISTPTDEISEHQVQDLQSRLNSLPEDDVKVPASPQSHKSTSSRPRAQTQDNAESAPAIPKRAPSHTKKTHQALARQRSVSRMRSETTTATTTPSTPALTSDSLSRKSTSSSRHQSEHSSKEPVVARSSADMFSARTHSGSGIIDANHPFGAELAKLTEVAEEFSPRRETHEDVPRGRGRSSEDSDRSPSRPAMPPTPKATSPVAKPMRKQKPLIEPTVWDEEQLYLSKHGLRMFSAEEYMAEIGSPYTESFPASVY